MNRFFLCLYCGLGKFTRSNTQRFCSQRCAQRSDNKGDYRVLSLPDGSKMAEHRYLVEQQLGRKLLKNEHVHHLNGIRNDNRLENLEVIDIVDHAKLHAKETKKYPQERKCSVCEKLFIVVRTSAKRETCSKSCGYKKRSVSMGFVNGGKVSVACLFCGKEFLARSYEVKRGNCKTCGYTCARKLWYSSVSNKAFWARRRKEARNGAE